MEIIPIIDILTIDILTIDVLAHEFVSAVWAGGGNGIINESDLV